ncbi:MAG: hypothetical protein GF333_04010 [Candidatus Omnitrophica bacterium]|nr:hypothetical protein [Candidatus Omnitrophota bacterium]
MNVELNFPELCVSFVIGLALGGFFFGGLWYTIRLIQSSRRPYLVALTSFFLRLSVLGAAFYGIVNVMNWPAVISSVAGIIAVKIVFASRVRPRRTREKRTDESYPG